MSQPGPPYPPDFGPSGQQYPPGSPQYPPPYPPPAKKGRGAGKVVGIGCLSLIGLAIAGIAIAAVMSGPTRAPDTGAVAEPGRLSVFDLKAGDCYNVTERPRVPAIPVQPAGGPTTSELVETVEAVPCTSPHTYQVIAEVDFALSDSLAEVTKTRGLAACEVQFAKELSKAVRNDRSLNAGTLVPINQQSWDRSPAVACVVKSEAPISRSLVG